MYCQAFVASVAAGQLAIGIMMFGKCGVGASKIAQPDSATKPLLLASHHLAFDAVALHYWD
jgi:hypothetical protein